MEDGLTNLSCPRRCLHYGIYWQASCTLLAIRPSWEFNQIGLTLGTLSFSHWKRTWALLWTSTTLLCLCSLCLTLSSKFQRTSLWRKWSPIFLVRFSSLLLTSELIIGVSVCMLLFGLLVVIRGLGKTIEINQCYYGLFKQFKISAAWLLRDFWWVSQRLECSLDVGPLLLPIPGNQMPNGTQASISLACGISASGPSEDFLSL